MKFPANKIIVFAIILVCFFKVEVTAGEPDFSKSLTVTDSKIHYSTQEQYNYISCIGKIKNTSDIRWDDLVIEVQFLDSDNVLIDTLTEMLYEMVVPPHDEIFFRVEGRADKNEKEYAGHKVRITSANQVRKYSPRKKNMFLEILISWAPVLLLIAVWIFFMKKYQGKNSPQERIIKVQEKNYNLIERQNELFRELIDTIKQK